MSNLPVNLIISLLFMMLIIAVIVFIQVKLSRKENKYLGLIIPILNFLYSLITTLGMVSFITLTSSKNGVVEKTVNNIEYLGIFFTFLVSNIPTMILGGIYYSERNKIKVNKSIEKMKMEDL